jgi:hypothetical protein
MKRPINEMRYSSSIRVKLAAHNKKTRNLFQVSAGNPKGRDRLRDLDADERKIFKRIYVSKYIAGEVGF